MEIVFRFNESQDTVNWKSMMYKRSTFSTCGPFFKCRIVCMKTNCVLRGASITTLAEIHSGTSQIFLKQPWSCCKAEIIAMSSNSEEEMSKSSCKND
jgi:hypothetical protein